MARYLGDVREIDFGSGGGSGLELDDGDVANDLPWGDGPSTKLKEWQGKNALEPVSYGGGSSFKEKLARMNPVPIVRAKWDALPPKAKTGVVIAGSAVAAGLFWWFIVRPGVAKAASAIAPGYDTGGREALKPSGGANQYTIQAGDTMTKIAKGHLGDESLALWIYDLNRGVIGTNINLIRTGDKLWIPTPVSVAQAPAAALADFRRRYTALQEVYKAACTPASARGGRGKINCNVTGILPVPASVSEPTVVPKGAGDSFEYVKS